VCFRLRFTSSLGLNREPTVRTGGRYGRSPPILGNVVARSGLIRGGTLGTGVRYGYIPRMGGRYFAVSFLKICNFCRGWCERVVRPNPPVQVVVLSSVVGNIKLGIIINMK
jgi:hypothetical protein